MGGDAFRSIEAVQQEQEAALIALANQAVAETDADIVIFGGAPLAGLAETVRDAIPVPVVDQVQAALK
jgi:allantoin racemase